MSFSAIRPQSRSLSQPNCDQGPSVGVSRGRSFRYTDFWNELVATFKSEIQPTKHRRLLRVFDDCFEARDAVDSLLKVLRSRSERELTVMNALRLFRKFQEMNVVEDAQNPRNKAPLDDEESARLFRFVMPAESGGKSSSTDKENCEDGKYAQKTPRSIKADSEYHLSNIADEKLQFDSGSKIRQSDLVAPVGSKERNVVSQSSTARRFVETPRRVLEPKVLAESLADNHYSTTSRASIASCDFTTGNRFMKVIESENTPSSASVEEPGKRQADNLTVFGPFRDALLAKLRPLLVDRFGFNAFAAGISDTHVRHNCTHTTRCGLVTELPRELLYPDWLLTTMRTLTATAPSRRSNPDTSANVSAQSSIEQFRGLESECYGTIVKYVTEEYAKLGPVVPQPLIILLSTILAKRSSQRDDIELPAMRRANGSGSRLNRGRQMSRFDSHLSPIAGSPNVEELPARSRKLESLSHAEFEPDNDLESCIDLFRYTLLALPPTNRRKLYVLARFMNKLVSIDEDQTQTEQAAGSPTPTPRCQLDSNRSNRQVIEQTLMRPICGAATDGNLFVRFVVDHYRSVFVVPSDLRSLAVPTSSTNTTECSSLSTGTALSECSSASKFTFSSDGSSQPQTRPALLVGRTKPPVAPKPKVVSKPATAMVVNSSSRDQFAVPVLPARVSASLPQQAAAPTPTRVTTAATIDRCGYQSDWQQITTSSSTLETASVSLRTRTPRRTESLTQYDRSARRSVCVDVYNESPSLPPQPTVTAQSFADIRTFEQDCAEAFGCNVTSQSYQSGLNWTSQSHGQTVTPPNNAATAGNNTNTSGRSSGRGSRLSRKTEEELTRLIDYVYRNEKGELSRGEREKRLKQFAQVYPQLYARYRGDEDPTAASHAITPHTHMVHRRSSGLSSFLSKLSQTFLNK